MEKVLIFTNGLENFQDQKLVSLLASISIWELIILLTNNWNMILKLEVSGSCEVLKWKVMPYNKVDEISAYHDICYDMGSNKGECERKMVKALDQIPYGEMPKWGSTARFLINTKQKLGLGVN